jgi:septum site-determining protein MinC
MAFVLSPAEPIDAWLSELEKWSRNSPDFFAGRPIILDLAGAPLSETGIADLVAILAQRGIRVMGIEGVDQLSAALPPVLKGGRPTGAGETPPATSQGGAGAVRPEPSSLLIESPIRSGQSVAFPYGDITVLGSVSSGAEVVAGGSIHIYGALRGRAMAGSTGNARSRIYCSRNEAELVSIDGYYRTAEEMGANLRGRPTQCWLENRVVSIAALD